jgi:PAS domain S-box-containing protein
LLIKQLKVLYIEDDKASREKLSFFLEQKTSKVTVCEDGLDGLAAFKEDRPDIVISDIKMPNLDGLGMVKEMKKIDQDVMVIFISAYSDPSLVVQALELGVKRFIFKPLRYKELEKSLDEIASQIDYENQIKKQHKLIVEYQKVVEESSIVSKTDLRGNITYINDQFCKISGFKREELIGVSHNIVRHPDVSSDVYKVMWEQILKKEIWRGELKNIAKDGRVYYVDTTILPILDENDTISEFISIRHDITRLKKREIEISEAKILTEKILNAQHNIVALFTKERGLIEANERFFEQFSINNIEDFHKEEREMCDLFIKEEGYLYKKSTMDWIETILINEKRYRAKAVDFRGEEKTFSLFAQKIDLHNQDYFIVTLHDVTQEEMAIQKARRADHAKGEFLANMSHEIRTPLNAIVGFSKLLEEEIQTEQEKNYAKIITNSANGLLGIINDILDFSKIEQGKLEVESIESNIPLEIETIIELFYSVALEKNINLRLFIDPFIAGCLNSDPLRIRQVLSNLISNAIKFTPQNGEINIRIKSLCSIEKECAQLFFEVRDSGIGISKEKQEHIFNAFSQADSTITREFGGTGLGLSISNKLVSLLGGVLELESTQGEGSRFFFTLDVEECLENSSKPIIRKPRHETIAVLSSLSNEALKNFNLLRHYLAPIGFNVILIEDEETLKNSCNSLDVLIVFNSYKKECLDCLNRNIPILLIAHYAQTLTDVNVTQILHYPLYGTKIYKTIAEVLNLRPKEKLNKNIELHVYNTKVLVAEDNVVNQKLIIIILEKFGCQVDVASDGLEALNYVKTKQYDIIFMDINMPVMDGVEATKEIISMQETLKQRKTPIVALTANALAGDKEKFISLGMSDYLSKPIDASEIEKTLKKYCQEIKKVVQKSKSVVQIRGDEHFNIAMGIKGLHVTYDTLLSLTKEFLESINREIKALEDALKSENFRIATGLIHKLKGSSGNLRLNILSKLCKDAEVVIKQSEVPHSLLREIKNEISLLVQRIK